MDERSLQEAAAPLIALAHCWQQMGLANGGTASSAALPLLEQLLTLCSAQRGAVLLPRGPTLAPDGAELSAGTGLAQIRLLAQLGMNEQDLSPLLQAYALAGTEVWMSPAAPAWLLYRLPLASSTVSMTMDPAGSTAEATGTQAELPDEALLVLGWEMPQPDHSFAARQQGSALLPLLADVAGLLLSNLLLAERVQAQREVLPIDLLANVNHELRSPLTLIKGATETLLLLDRCTSRQQRREFLLTIKEASYEMVDKIDRLLELAQLDNGNLDLVHAPVNLAHLVREAVQSAQERLATPMQQPGVPRAQVPVRFSWRLEDMQEGEPMQAEPLIQADRRRLREILDHLLANAVAYSPAGGTIEVTMRPMSVQDLTSSGPRTPSAPTPRQAQEDRSSCLTAAPQQQGMELVIRDQGMGIPSEQLEQIFAPFYRLNMTLSCQVPGLGLGLTLCRRLVEEHGGRIWAESVVGQGSAFHIWLPAMSEQDQSMLSGKEGA